MKGKTIYKLSIASSTLSSFKTGGARGNVDLKMIHTDSVSTYKKNCFLGFVLKQEFEIMPPRILGNRVRDRVW